VRSVKISAVISPKRKPPEEEEVGVRKEKLSSEVTRRDVVTRDVTRRDAGMRGLKAGTKRTQLEAGCSRRRNVQITEDNEAKMRFQTFKKGGSEQKEKRKGGSFHIRRSQKIGRGRGPPEDDDRYCDWEVTVPELVEENAIIPHALRQRDGKLESSRRGKRM